MKQASLALALAALAVSCSGEAKQTAGHPEQPAAPAGASADGMCHEHGVLEAVCTKCNPALVAVFKAKGDFCEEHGFPESFCPICHPERGGKPATDVTDDGSPPDGVRVRFKTKETAQLAGIETAKVAKRAGASLLPVTARIVYDATKVAQVNARSPGVVRAIRADVGVSVKAGTPLATIESAALGADVSRLQAERSRLQVADARYARVSQLSASGILPEKEVLDARQQVDEAKAALASVEAALGVVGGSAGSARYTLTAPIAGVVTQRSATIGRVVGTEEVLFEIVDTSSMWAEVDIPESALSRVMVGREVSVAIEGLPDQSFTGTLDYVAPTIDPRTRTAVGRVALNNPEGLLRGNMFARAEISISGAADALVVPRDAVQRAKGVSLVFVRIAQDTFEGRRVVLGSADDRTIEVRGRLAAGDDVATTGSFLLRTETLKGSIGAGCCDVE
jgi:cobalt-zinc-cadmium efflux system membrane fusion protein